MTSNIQFESAEYGSYVLADGVITQIVTTVDGWTACTNDITPIKGRLTQTDAEARTSYTNRVASRGTGTVASIVSLLYSDVEGVTFAAGYENYNDTTDAAGRPPHSIEIVVQAALTKTWPISSGRTRRVASVHTESIMLTLPMSTAIGSIWNSLA